MRAVGYAETVVLDVECDNSCGDELRQAEGDFFSRDFAARSVSTER